MSVGRALALVALVVLTTVTFWPVVDHGFLNWDDPETLRDNAALGLPTGALLAWAVSTTHMGHYQPLSWLALAWLGGDPIDASRLHLLAVGLHAVTVGLLFLAAATFAERHPLDGAASLTTAAAVAIFAVHPLRVEPVAWASALPYLLSAAPLVVAVVCWTSWTRNGHRSWWWAAWTAFTVSQLARVTAPLLPVVLVLVARADRRARPMALADLVRAAAPLAAVAMVLAVVEALARDAAPLSDIGLSTRVASAVAQPSLYLWRTLAPVGLSPLDVLPRGGAPDWGQAAVGAIALMVLVLGTRQVAGGRVSLAVWGSYVALLAPFLGLQGSGVQATADRYTYVAAMGLSVALAVALVRAATGLRQVALLVAGAAAVAAVDASRTQLAWWRDSTTLWARAVDLDPDNDVAIYNLALARGAAGDVAGAVAGYDRLLTLVPDHAPARRARNALVADAAQRDGDAAAQAGRWREAVSSYDRVLAADPARVRARVNRGMALTRLGEFARALPDLEAAAAPLDPPVASALAFALVDAGRTAAALATLSRAVTAFPDDVGLAANYARLLLTAEPPSLRDAERGLALASRAATASGMRDPRLLDTLGLGFAAVGQASDAREAWTRGAALARQAGDTEFAAALNARVVALGR